MLIMSKVRKSAALVRDPRTHDYTNARRGWGHDIAYRPVKDNRYQLSFEGWGHGIEDGDFIILTHPQDHQPVKYKVDEIEYFMNPRDMFSGLMTYVRE